MTEWNKEKILNLLAVNDKAVGRAILRVYANQTQDEQNLQHVIYKNGKGFRPQHARMGTSMAEFLLKKGFLSSKQVAYWRVRDKKGTMRIGIYANQLLSEIR
jgi:hypothetical protein